MMELGSRSGQRSTVYAVLWVRNQQLGSVGGKFDRLTYTQ